MKLKIVSVRDRQANAYGRPIFINAVGQAIRSFADEVNRPAENNEMNRHPADFELFEIGTFDDETGEITGCNPIQLALGENMKINRE